MRFVVFGTDQETGHAIELTLEAPDAHTAAKLAARKGISVSGVRVLETMVPPPLQQTVPSPRPASQHHISTRTATSRPPQTKKKRDRLWLTFLLLIAALVFPAYPGVPLWTGIVLLAVIGVYIFPPLRGTVGGFLRVSPDRPVWMTFKLSFFILVGVVLIGLSFAGQEITADREAAEVKRQTDAAAKVLADSKAFAHVAKLVADATTSLNAGDVMQAESVLENALRSSAPNRALAQTLLANIRKSTDPTWTMKVLIEATDEDLTRFLEHGTPPNELSLPYPALTARAVALARTQLNDAMGKRAEAKQAAVGAAAAQAVEAVEAVEAARVASEARNFVPVEITPSSSTTQQNEVMVTREEYGEAWPFTVDSGLLSGKPTGSKTRGGTELAEVTFTANGKTYAVNGIARGTKRYAEIDAIWADNPQLPGSKKNIGPIISRGLDLAKATPTPIPRSTPTANLDASVSFTGTQFLIRNNNAYGWTNVKMEINGGVFSSGYVLRTERMDAGQTYTVGAAQFTKSDGARFDPFTHKPLQFTLFCTEGNSFFSWQ